MTKDFGPEFHKPVQWRASFKYHVLIYFIVNILLWTMWYISLKNIPEPKATINSIPWPAWPMVGWGIVVVLHYVAAFKVNNLQQKDELPNQKK